MNDIEDFVYFLIGVQHGVVELANELNDPKSGIRYADLSSADKHKLTTGFHLKGIFKAEEDVINLIENYGNEMHECGYFTHFVIERRVLGYEGVDWDWENENILWYEAVFDGDSFVQYKRIETPQAYKQIINLI
jgi:hypothetical protein